MKTTHEISGQTWLSALREAANVEGIALPGFDGFGMGAMRSTQTAGGRFVTLKRRVGATANSEFEGVEWALWQQQGDDPIPVAVFRESLIPHQQNVARTMSLLSGWLSDQWTADEAKKEAGKHPGVQIIKDPPAKIVESTN